MIARVTDVTLFVATREVGPDEFTLRSMYLCQLACGHKRRVPDKGGVPPTRLKCKTCSKRGAP